MSAPRSTGLSGVDAQHDFRRARRRATIAKLIARLRGEPDDVAVLLPYERAIEALGFLNEHSAGLQVVALEEIVGSVGRGRGFDRRFRPTTTRSPRRWRLGASAPRRASANRSTASTRRSSGSRPSTARSVAMLRDTGLVEGRTDAEAYMNIAAERYRLLRTHEWNEDVLRQVLEGRAPRRRLRG